MISLFLKSYIICPVFHKNLESFPRNSPDCFHKFSRAFVDSIIVELWSNFGGIYATKMMGFSCIASEKTLENFLRKPPDYSREFFWEFLVTIIVKLWLNFGGIYVKSIIEFSCIVSEKNLENFAGKPPAFSREFLRAILVAIIVELWWNLRGKRTCPCHVGFHQMGSRGLLVGPRGRPAGMPTEKLNT